MRHPHGLRAALRGAVQAVQVGTMTWAGTNESSVSITDTSLSYTTSGNATGNQTYGVVFPTIDATGLYLDVQLLQGSDTSPTHVAWLGVCNTTTSFTNANRARFTGWYWSGVIQSPGPTSSSVNETTLSAATYRIALRTEGGTPQFYIRKSGGLIRGPINVPTGSLRLMMLAQGGFPLPAATILNAGAVYQGGGGLF
jgi:hypothetical protein